MGVITKCRSPYNRPEYIHNEQMTQEYPITYARLMWNNTNEYSALLHRLTTLDIAALSHMPFSLEIGHGSFVRPLMPISARTHQI